MSSGQYEAKRKELEFGMAQNFPLQATRAVKGFAAQLEEILNRHKVIVQMVHLRYKIPSQQRGFKI